MSPDRIEKEQNTQLPEMPGTEHVPALVKWFGEDQNSHIISSRERLRNVLETRGADPEDIIFLNQTAALASWIHRKEIRLTGEPYVVHTLEVAAMALSHPSIPLDQIRRAGAGILLHDAIENNPHVTKEALVPHVGIEAAEDIDIYYSKKKARNKLEGIIEEISPEDYLAKFLESEFHLKIGKVTDRMHNMDNMPEDNKHRSKTLKMYDRYFRRETDAMVKIILSMGINVARSVYEEYRRIHNKNKPPDVEDLPPFEETNE